MKLFAPVLFLALFAATLAGNWNGLCGFVKGAKWTASSWNGRNFKSSGEHMDAPRELAEKHVPPGESVYYCASSNDGALNSTGRSTHLALSWARSPEPVRFGGRDDFGDASAIIVSRFLRVDFSGYLRHAENKSAVLWLREDVAAAIARCKVGGACSSPAKRLRHEEELRIMQAPSFCQQCAGGAASSPHFAPPAAPAPWREAAGAGVVCALVALFVRRMRGERNVDFCSSGAVSPEAPPSRAEMLELRQGCDCATKDTLAQPIRHLPATQRRNYRLPATQRRNYRFRRTLTFAPKLCGFPCICVAVFFIFAAAAALTHTFLAPGGLGVYGGKAKLIYLSGGIPDGFFTDPAFSSYQPAYPPGLALLTLLSYWISGGCGEWLTQLIPLFAASAALWILASQTCAARGSARPPHTRPPFASRCASCFAALWILAAFLDKWTLQMATLYYAEPFVALLALLGWTRLRENRGDWRGWLLLGATGFFKNEGIIILFAIWVVFATCAMLGSRQIRMPRSKQPTRTSALPATPALPVFPALPAPPFKHLFAAAALPLAWHAACRMAGAELYDYAPVLAPDPAKFFAALAHLLKLAFFEPWRYGFAHPIAALALATDIIMRIPRRKATPPQEPHPLRGLREAALAAFFCLAAFAFVYSLSLAPNFAWHLNSSAARLLWAPSLLVLAEASVTKINRKGIQRETAI